MKYYIDIHLLRNLIRTHTHYYRLWVHPNWWWLAYINHWESIWRYRYSQRFIWCHEKPLKIYEKSILVNLNSTQLICNTQKKYYFKNLWLHIDTFTFYNKLLRVNGDYFMWNSEKHTPRAILPNEIYFVHKYCQKENIHPRGALVASHKNPIFTHLHWHTKTLDKH